MVSTVDTQQNSARGEAARRFESAQRMKKAALDAGKEMVKEEPYYSERNANFSPDVKAKHVGFVLEETHAGFVAVPVYQLKNRDFRSVKYSGSGVTDMLVHKHEIIFGT
ncbi:MAG: hypothetical protein HZA34_04070 [Candidatus Pacebacteria bacterium]|nr:hypothetical protein [Candidatus Paceibacterota bacterium]